MADRPTEEIEESYDLFIGGGSVQATSGGTLTSNNPATEEPLTEVAAGQEDDVDVAVSSARDALDAWQGMNPPERGRILHRLAALIREERDRLARIETLENGKPISDARGDVVGCARNFEYYAGVADKIQGDSIPLDDQHVDFSMREPLGVIGIIVPWNFPISTMARSLAPALTTGNAVVVKPSEETSLTALEVAKLAIEAGVPPGVVNVVPGFGSEAGAALSEHPDIDGVSFTGSVPTGQMVGKAAMENLTHVTLELGGKSPNVVFPDADFETAVEQTMKGIFYNTGQTCSAGSRLIIHEDVHDDILDEILSRTQELTLGPGMEDPDLGPLISQTQLDKVERYIELGRKEVGEPIVGGSILDRVGYFVEPTIFDNVDNGTRLAQEEIFGPVLSVMTFSTEEEALELANDVQYGLVAGVFTENNGRAYRFARNVEAGLVYINEWFAGGVETPFGGFKKSGVGREKGLEALDNYTQIKSVCANISRR